MREVAAGIIRKVYDAIPPSSVYERDLQHKLAGSLSQHHIALAVQFLINRRYIKRAGDSARPILVRSEAAKVVYSNIAPLTPPVAYTLTTMHSNFEEKPR